MPGWLQTGLDTYLRRIPKPTTVCLQEIKAPKKSGAQPTWLKDKAGQALLAALPNNSHLVALDPNGSLWDTPTLAQQYDQWQIQAKPVYLAIGGADGLSTAVLQAAQQVWSLSQLTFPHYLVRVLVAEQLYRAHTLLHHHPYHR